MATILLGVKQMPPAVFAFTSSRATILLLLMGLTRAKSGVKCVGGEEDNGVTR